MRATVLGVSLFFALGACGRLGFELVSDAGGDTGQTPESGVDAAEDAAGDAASIADTGVDAPTDANPEDAAADATSAIDAGADAADATIDAGPPPVFPVIQHYALSATGYHTCIARNGLAYCWGRNRNGELGLGDAMNRTTPTQVTLPGGGTVAAISAGEGHTCAVEDGTQQLWCWGDNTHGQLGLGDQMERHVPTRVTALPRVLQVSAAYGFTCAITDDNALWCWGDNFEGGLGLDDDANRIFEVHVPTRSGTDNDWIQIASGQARSCGLRAPGQLWCVGRNAGFGLGLGFNVPNQFNRWTRVDSSDNWARVSVSQDGACALRGGRALCWGTFASGPVTVIQAPTAVDSNTWVGGTAGVFNACGILDTRAMVCWGRNSEGQLGSSDFVENVPVTIVGLEFDWLSVAMGRFHTCAQKLDGRILCTGENADGQLGLGDMNRRSAMTQVTLP